MIFGAQGRLPRTSAERLDARGRFGTAQAGTTRAHTIPSLTGSTREDDMTTLAMIGWTEILVIGGLLVLLFGARKLPELARAAGSSISQFKKGLKEEEQLAAGADEKGAKKELP